MSSNSFVPAEQFDVSSVSTLFQKQCSSEDASEHDYMSNLLDEAERIIDDSPIFEPTPIGPQGVENVVNAVPLEQSNWNIMELGVLSSVLMTSLMHQQHQAPVPSVSSGHPWVKRDFADYDASHPSIFPRLPQPEDLDPLLHAALPHFGNPGNISSNDEATVEEVKKSGEERFRNYQSEQWHERLADLVKFREENGDCLVPHDYKKNK